jgi:hypothetical protein
MSKKENMKNKIIWKRDGKIQINGYVGNEIKFYINSFYNRNFAIPINKKYVGETWLMYNRICFKLSSVKEAMDVCEIIENTGKPPKYLKGLFPKCWAVWYRIFPSILFGVKQPSILSDIGINVDFPVILTEQEYPSYYKRKLSKTIK